MNYFESTVTNVPAPIVRIVASGDINNDGLIDLVFADQSKWASRVKIPLRVGVYDGQGGFSVQAILSNAEALSFIDPRVIVGDFTGDGVNDLVVYDGGWYDGISHGAEPVLLIRNLSGSFTASTALKDALQPLVTTKPEGYAGGYQVDLTVGVKDIASADIDGDGDLDLWIESTGGANLTSHFVINDGTGVFSVDINNRVKNSLLFGPNYHNGAGPDYFRYGIGDFEDVNSDGKPDLILGQIRDNHTTHVDQSSFLLINDGQGYYPESLSIKLPLPNFYHGYTSVQDAASWDVNQDGYKDIVLVHTRNDGVSGLDAEIPWVGTYIQILISQSGKDFVDKTDFYLGNQEVWSGLDNKSGQHARSITPFDINHDGKSDFLLSYSTGLAPSVQRPFGFWATADGSFRPIDPNFLTSGDPALGKSLTPIDFQKDNLLDFVSLVVQKGPNQTYDGILSDDYNSLTLQTGTSEFGKATVTDMASSGGQVFRLYLTVLGRNPQADPIGCGFWIDKLEKGILTAEQMVTNFLNSTEFVSRFGSSSTSNDSFVNLMYQNLLGRDGRPDAGYKFWLSVLNDHQASREQVVVGFMNSPENIANSAPLIGDSPTYQEWLG